MPRLRRGAIALSAAVVLLAATGVSAREPDHDRLEEIEEQIEAKEGRLDEVQDQARGLKDQLEAAGARQHDLAARVREIQAQLGLARADLAEVRGQLDLAQVELDRWTAKLDAARADLEAQQAVIGEHARTAYVLGPAASLEVLLGSESLTDLSARAAYLEQVLTVDSEVLEGVRVSRSLVAERQHRVNLYEHAVAQELAELQERTAALTELETEQSGLLEQVDLEIEVQSDLLADVQAAKQRYEEQVAELELESARIRGIIQAGGSTGTGVGIHLSWPTDGPIVSGFGYRVHPIYGTTRFHSGVDIDGVCGQPIVAAASGEVLSAGTNGGYGLATVIDHGIGLSTLYAHQSVLGVSAGESVQRGEVIGQVGTTGLSTGCHLHFEVRINGEPVDPVPYLT